ncbi:MAG: AAA family ATPase [bacterium]
MRRALGWTAAAGLAVFAIACLDLFQSGPLTTRLDPAVNDAVLRAQDAGLAVGDVGAILSLPGAGPVDVVVVAAAALLLAAWRRWESAAFVMLTPTLGGRLVDVMKEFFERGFPPGEIVFATGAGAAASEVHNPAPFVGPAYAFPSGHTMGALLSVALAVILVAEAWMQRRGMPSHRAWRVRWSVLAACGALVVLTGIARVLLTVHWVSDVLASWGLGTAIICGVLLATGWGEPAPLDAATRRNVVRVLGFTGMPGSGKSEAMEVAKARSIPVVRMGDLIWEEVERRGLPRDAKHVGQVANDMRESHGKDIWSKRTVEKVRHVARDKGIVIIDGVRSDAEVETFRSELGGDFVLVAIHTDRHHRFERMLARGRADDPKDEAVLQVRDEREIGWGMAECIALADEMIVNDSDLPEFRAKVGALLDRLA